ncbi:glycoside hydrolase family 2 TIM barrel-domain containing protein [Duganella zoogloeoides]|uniref:Glycoside hydrolase family 2 TIM barrel-domain containing protein n=1 Tax=Duganella zoogloeoides TaxID=75659 RepID=A0ABZ0Y4F5_9BURK|nr:glycoside hydrolase family 2 TIM barrel-domain containing protein [Duganella zoogloeoides]WQH06942.1 glycoside hydrolase family 2 TIM barrel-domain containing protein [Duganella zoogloeoides]
MRLTKQFPTIGVLALAVASSASAATIAATSLNQSWDFYRDDAKVAATVDKVPANGWSRVNLPHTARLEAKVPVNSWQGTAFYKKSFDAKVAPGEQAILRFEGAMNVADVWVNGKHLGQHLGGYLPFSYDVTPHLKAGGGNELVVRINNEDNAITGPKPLKDLDYIQYGGIYRDVTLTIKPAVHISDEMLSNTAAGGGIFVTYPQIDKASATVRVKAEVCNTAAEPRTAELRHRLLSKNTRVADGVDNVSLAAGECKHVTRDLKVDRPQLWSPKAPNLYALETTVASRGQSDLVKTRIGIRRIEMAKGKLLINGEQTFLRGVNRHQEYPYVGYALSPQAEYRDALLIKRAGFDYIRLSHYPHSPAFMAAADELGIMVVPGIPGWQYFNPDPAFTTQVVKTCTDMVRRDRNHASVLAWECSLNETQMPDALVEKLHQTVHTEFPGGQAYSAGWVPQTYDVYLQARQHRLEDKRPLPDKALIVSEYGDWEYYAMNAGFNQTAWGDLKAADRSSRQLLADGETRLLQQAKNLAESHDDNFNTGAVADGYWVMFDYGRGYAPDLESSGIMTIDRLPKFSNEFFRSQRSALESSKWGGGPMVFIASHWNKDSSPQVRVFSNTDEVELFLNGQSLGRVKSAPTKLHPNLKHPPLEFNAGQYAAGELKAIAWLGGKKVAEHVVRTASEAAKLDVSVDDLGVKSTAGDLVFIRAKTVDAKGNLVAGSGQSVKFTAGGAYEIVGPATVTTEGGIASVLVRVGANGGKGSITADGGTVRGKL